MAARSSNNSATSPAERYAAARSRQAHPRLTEFLGELDFELDPFQVASCQALEGGHAVLVCAPTGAGKTVVGEFAVHLALAEGRKCFYTTPIKALSNQKYADLCARHGAANVGLLTGDAAVNGNAPVVVMTTEVLRNMLYAGSSSLDGLGYVVMDEVHYLADRFRGAVWEEVILHLPESVRLVSLSATVSNAEEFGEWLVAVRGDTSVVVDEHRPVPLWQHMMVGSRTMDLFGGESAGELKLNPHLLRQVQNTERAEPAWRGSRRDRAPRDRRNGVSHPARFRPPARPDVITRLGAAGLLPAIVFVFSRAGCDAAVTQCVRGGLRLTSEAEVEEIRRVIDRKTVGVPENDLAVLGYWEWRDALERGIAAHHAGMLPAFKETVEELFVRGLVRAVFATETLALGINMPARTVVLEKLVKYNGEAHVDLTPGEYTQLTGRAGRRGIDVEGHAVVMWQPGVDPRQVAGLASTRTYPLRSSFRPGYNMAVNLVHRVGVPAARDLLEQSFAQFQADRSVVGLSRRIERNDEALAGYRESARCHLGDFDEYMELRRRVSAREKVLAKQNSAGRRADAAASLERLRKGDVIAVPSGRRSGLAVVVDPGLDPLNEPRPLVVTEDRWAGRLSVVDFPTPVEALGRMRLPKHVEVRSPRSRRDLASALRDTGIAVPARGRSRSGAPHEDGELNTLRRALRSHPCHGCDSREDHARWAERHHRLQGENDQLRRKVAGTTHSLVRTFDRIRALLRSRGYLTPAPPVAGRGDTAVDAAAADSTAPGAPGTAVTSSAAATSADLPARPDSTAGEAAERRDVGEPDGPKPDSEIEHGAAEAERTVAASSEGRGTVVVVDEETISEHGRRLARIYSESDLLAAECLRHGVWRGLGPAELASVVSALVFESRRDTGPVAALPEGPVTTALAETLRIWADLEDDERRHRLDRTREPDAGFAWPVYRWARGESLERVLTAAESAGHELSAGDFVRWCRQVVDLLDQLRNVVGKGDPVGAAAGRAVTALRRGVVAMGTA
ncbi:ATP-dependent RNA helicase HelY [Actinoalloteichus hoggarensis]|uniref:Ski2-like helicase n=1 Tax=Actinoalloteichus hoggarensis TaxID=1470176 RepID=A0A221W2Y0_9PSEU|nr:DEAD/DEAH box helicase [Actinoalloteichus hoggarensis]ASO20086.1 ski2-like helicase [Actinoalloteichus hoggarensis]MBB5919202.1 ATP-dependent RNA helicase HelY [Actinoalloteichus hoggarensis]